MRAHSGSCNALDKTLQCQPWRGHTAPDKGDAQCILLSCDHVMTLQEQKRLVPSTGMLTVKEPYLSKQRLCHGPSAPLLVLSLWAWLLMKGGSAQQRRSYSTPSSCLGQHCTWCSAESALCSRQRCRPGKTMCSEHAQSQSAHCPSWHCDPPLGPSPKPGANSAQASSWPGLQSSWQKPCGALLQLPSLKDRHWRPAVSWHILQSGCPMRLCNSLRTPYRAGRLLTRACRAPAGRLLAFTDAQGA